MISNLLGLKYSRIFSASAAALALFCMNGCGGGSGGSPLAPGFNLDFHTTSTQTSATFGASSGQVGTWVNCAVGNTAALTNVAGTVTAVSITLVGAADSFGTGAGTDTRLLMADGIKTDATVPVAFKATISGLENGDYRVYYYSHSLTDGLTANGIAMTNLTALGTADSRDNLGAQGFNWDFVDVTVTGGSLVIDDTTPADISGLSGIQIIPR